MNRRRLIFSILSGLLFVTAPSSAQDVDGDQLVPTVHPILPSKATDLWLVPTERDRAARSIATYEALVAGEKRFQDGNFAAAISLLTRPSLATTALADYAVYYTGLSQLRLGRVPEARRTFDTLIERKPQGALAIAAPLAAGEAAEAAGDHAGAVRIYEGLTAEKGAVTEDVLTRLGHAALAAGDRKKAAEAFVRAYYEFPLTDSATIAGAQLPALQDQVTRTGYKLDIGRAQLLFGARRYAEARTAFQELQRVVDGDDKELADLRVAECDFNLKQYAAARDELRPYLDRASRKAEARFFYLSSLRELGDHLQYIALTSALVSEFPDSSWSEEALNNLATHYILMSEDALATRTFRELHDKFPSGLRTERAAWKYGWAAYKTGDYPEAIRVFEAAAARFPRSDYRPLYLYWAARSHGKLDQAAQADARLQLVYTDYGNSYYGRLAARQLTRSGTPLTIPADVRLASQQSAPAPDLTPIPTDSLIRLLLANGLYDDALGELRYAKRAWGNSSRIDATIAWVYHEQGLLRPAISLMRRTYPQHLTGGGQELPAEIRQVIFPLSYWNSIRKQSALRGLDPYLVAALIGQESTFDPNITSSANAWGLMQILPTTGRRLAKSLGIRNFKTGLLTNPEVNLRLGTLYFSRLVEQFGGSYYALASYNAGESRIVRWKAERPGMEEDEFIDDIPFPETQNYVKRILGTAEDYRMLYGGAGTPGEPSVLPAKAKAASEDPAVVPATARVKSPVVKKPVAKQKKAPARPARKKHRR